MGHPTYEKWGKKAGSLQERMKKVKPLYAYSEERAKFEEEWYKKHGRAWWIFQGMTIRHQTVERTWENKKDDVFVNIMQYYVPDNRK